MSRHVSEYKDLVGLLLGPIRERPGMYLGEPKLSNLINFITGYQMCRHMNTSPTSDRYFDNPGFLEWYEDTYKKELGSYWTTLFLEEAGWDEKEALKLYFNYLEEYSNTTGGYSSKT